MAFASATTIASGSSASVAVPFQYLEKADVHVSVNGVQVADNLLVWASPTTITLPSTPANGASVTVWRSTPATSLKAQLVDGAFYDETDLNSVLLQLLYVAQESYDAGNTSASELATIINTVNNAMASASESATAAAGSASAASTSATNAANSASAAASSATQAASYAGGGAPAGAGYILSASQAGLSSASVLTNGTFISWAISAGTAVATLIDGAITLAKLAASCFASQAQAQATTGQDNTTIMTPLRVWQAIAAYMTANPVAAYTPRTGSLRPTHNSAAETGWILWSDGTIGNASSNATLRANADTSALFAVYYALSDALCPLYTSTGAATTRAAQGGASTAYAANCAVALPKGAGRFVGVAGAGSGLSTRLNGSTVGAETQTVTTSNLPNHSHGTAGNTGTAFGGGTSIDQSEMSTGASNGGPYSGVMGSGAGTTSVGSGTPMNIMSPGAYLNWEIKL